MDIRLGNVNQFSKERKGWIVGHFMPDNSPLKTRNVEVKWINRKKGEIKKGHQNKQTAQTLIILISGKFMVRLPNRKREFVLSKEGDFVSFDSSACPHESKTLEDSRAIVIKWPSLPNKGMKSLKNF